MAYKKAELEKQAIEAIEKYNLVFVTDVPAYLPCSTATFYNKGLEKLESIKERLERNRIRIKNGLRKKWYESDNPTVQIALYKLIGTDDEAHRLNGSRKEIKQTGNIKITPLSFYPDEDAIVIEDEFIVEDE